MNRSESIRSCRAASRFAAALLLAAFAPSTFAQNLPPGFIVEDVVGNWTFPTYMSFAGSDDLLVAEKAGVVWDVRGGIRHAKPVIDLQQEILENGDRGLLCVTADPEWNSNGYIYLLYVADPNGDGSDAEQESFGRLTRYTTTIDVNGDLLADPASRKVLLGATWTEGIPSLYWSHSGDEMRFLSDGSLVLSTGDGGHSEVADFGGLDPNGFGSGKLDPSEDIGAMRAQSPTSLAGKLLRIDPATGLGLPDNPFYTGNPADHQSRIWAMGLRNPFRFCLEPGSGTRENVVVADVGWDTWEEIDRCSGGENFGWPCWEGPNVATAYTQGDPFGFCADPSLFTLPIWSYNHNDPGTIGFTGQCVSGIAYYTGSDYPSKYSGRLFYSEYAMGFIRTLSLVNGAVTGDELFLSNGSGPIDLIADPGNGDLYYIALQDHAIRRIRYTNSNRPPVAVATFTPAFGPKPLTVALDASASYDPEGGALTFDWDLGDGNHATTPALSHAYPLSQNYTIALTVTDPTGQTATKQQLISVDNTPPVITSLNSPPPGSFYTVGQAVTFDVTATDAEDDPAGKPLSVTWTIDLHHEHHVHPAWAILNGKNASFTPNLTDDGTYLHVTLVVTDSRSLTATEEFDLYDRNGLPYAHLVTLDDFAPRVGKEIEATGHVHYPGLGPAGLRFDWGDGTVDDFHASNMEDRHPRHTYVGPGSFLLRMSVTDGVHVDTRTQPIFVRPLAPAVAIFAPLSASHWMSPDEQWAVASQLADDIHAAGFEAEIFTAGDQPALQRWLASYLPDPTRDWLVCLDAGPSVAYAGQDDGSLAERWLGRGKGILWTGYTPFARYVTTDLVDRHAGAGPTAADELLDAATPRIASGVAQMLLGPDAADLPDLAPFPATRALKSANLSSGWSIAKLYASDHATPPVSDALVVRNANGGEYAQFFCASDATLPRSAVLREYFKSHVHVDLPPGPDPFHLIEPADRARDVAAQPTLSWSAPTNASSWLVEIAADRDFATPLFTTTVLRGTTIESVKRLAVDLRDHLGEILWWRVTEQNRYGWVVGGPQVFKVTNDGKPRTAR